MVEHSSISSVLPAANSPIAIRRRAWREFKDRAARYGVAFGGLSVIFAIVLIFFYLLHVVLPLFDGAEMDTVSEYTLESNKAVHIALNEYNDVALSANMDGLIRFFVADTGHTISTPALPLPLNSNIVSFSHGAPTTGVLAYGFDDGRALIFKREYKISYPDDKRYITPVITYPIGKALLKVDDRGRSLTSLTVQSSEEQTTVVGLTDINTLVLLGLIRQENFMDEDAFTLEEKRAEISLPSDEKITHIQMDIEQRELYLVDDSGFIFFYDISDISEPNLIQKVKAVPTGVNVTALSFLTGGISILVGRSDGQIDQWFPLRDLHNNYTLHNVRNFKEQESATVSYTHLTLPTNREV